MTSYPEAVDHVNDFDEMLHFIIKATASTRATIIHTIITEKSCLQKNEMHKHIIRDDFMQSRTILSIVSQTETDAHDFLLDLDFYDYFRFPILSSVLDTPCRIFFQFGLLSNIVKWTKNCQVGTTHTYSIFVDFLTVKKCSRCSMVVTSPKAFLETIIHEFISSSSLVFYCSVQL